MARNSRGNGTQSLDVVVVASFRLLPQETRRVLRQVFFLFVCASTCLRIPSLGLLRLNLLTLDIDPIESERVRRLHRPRLDQTASDSSNPNIDIHFQNPNLPCI